MSPARLSAALRDSDPVILEGLPPSGLAYLIAREGFVDPLVIVTANDERAEQISADLRALGTGEVAFFPSDAHLPFEDVSPDPRAVFQRLSIRHRILAGERPQVVVASARAIMGRWAPDAEFTSVTELWVQGDELGRDRLIAQLVRCGYQPVTLVEDEGTFAIRGGIIDVFPPGRDRPIRLDLFGDELSSLKSFDPESQRTFEALEALAIHPIRDVVYSDASVASALARLERMAEDMIIPTRRLHALMADIEQRHYFFGVESLWPMFYPPGPAVVDALRAGSTIAIIDDRDAVDAALADTWSRAQAERQRTVERHRPAVAAEEHFVVPDEASARLSAGPLITTVRVSTDRREKPLPIKLRDWRELAAQMQARREEASLGEILDPLVAEIRRQTDRRRSLYLTCGSRGNAERLRELLRGRHLDIPVQDAIDDPTSLGGPRRSARVAIVVTPLVSGLLDTEDGVAIITDVEIFGAKKRRQRGRQRAPAEGLATLRGLSEGDLVIHVDHGIGRYLGLKRLVLGGTDGDYVHLEYAGSDRLYLPIYRLNLLQRYRGPTEHVRLDKLGGTRWLKVKERVKDAVLELAHDLLAVQARRRFLPGMGFPEPDDHFRAFEATFPFEETPDQQRAIAEVIADLTRDQPMDRLVCGDVGFGKTEVALRAAFLATLAGKQTAVLVPTTVLAEQHGMTFRERLSGEPVSVEVLSRFRSRKDTRDLLARLKDGKVDVLIGTHRMLSPDAAFKDLGLLVIDEEQRFGVRQKERIKQLRSQVHVLTLSATPIPRTLHMAVTGLRDLSIIQTAPAERVSIRTEVSRFDEDIIREAITRELHRGGQVFLVHNRVQSIAAMASFVHGLVPQARVATAHGQMTATELERIMVEFVRREHNVLVCTAIIESGLDIPTANTMIVNRADMFGLSQLYQLRGRIGRSRERGYAYLMLPRSDRIRPDALERLSLLKRFSELGSGFQIASHDLDLRGAGDLLGANQSGNIAAVGFDLYTELLNEAVEKVRGQAARTDIEPEIKLPVTAVLPESYMPQPMQRLAFYQRMAQSTSDEAIYDVYEEIEDRYGHAPDEVRHLVEVMVIRRRLKTLGAIGLSAATEGGALKLGLTFMPDPPLDHRELTGRLQREPTRYRLLPSGRLMVTASIDPNATPAIFLATVRQEVGTLPGSRVSKP